MLALLLQLECGRLCAGRPQWAISKRGPPHVKAKRVTLTRRSIADSNIAVFDFLCSMAMPKCEEPVVLELLGLASGLRRRNRGGPDL